MVRLETDAVSLGIVVLRDIAIPVEYPDLPPPAVTGDPAVTRRLYHAIGQDPTRNRPSSEALLRRLKKGLGLPRINALVDAVNHCSVALQLSFGCYDLDRISGSPVLRLGRPGEAYEAVGHRPMNLEGRYALCDDLGPFGNPTMDSQRTRIVPETRNALVVIFAPPDHPHDRLVWVAGVLTTAVSGRAEPTIVR